jgi:hypothetical protein
MPCSVADLAGLPMPCKLTPTTKKKLLNDVVSWVRKNPNPNSVDDRTVCALANIAGMPVPVPRANISPGQKVSHFR